MESQILVELTAEIVSAHVANNQVEIGDIGRLVLQVHQTLASLGKQEQAPEPKHPVVSIRASVRPDHLVCMECGAKQKMLKRHLQTAHGLTPAEYRRDYGLPDSYPMSAPDYSEQRRELAKSIGLGRKSGAKPKGNAGRSRLSVRFNGKNGNGGPSKG